jgi:hypothetical protein
LVFASVGRDLRPGFPSLEVWKMQKPNQGSEKKRELRHFGLFLDLEPNQGAGEHDA